MPKPNSRPSSRPTSARKSTDGGSQLRIIGGQYRGRKLRFPDVDGLRPTGDRIRETLFNWLAPEMAGARCLDLFAGSGALGLECLSRGAASVTMIEKDHQAFATLKQNIATLGATNADLRHADTLAVLARPPASPYHIVFIDPPFAGGLWQATVAALETNQWLTEDASIYVELPKTECFLAPAHWQLHRDKGAGAVSYRLYYRTNSSSVAED